MPNFHSLILRRIDERGAVGGEKTNTVESEYWIVIRSVGETWRVYCREVAISSIGSCLYPRWWWVNSLLYQDLYTCEQYVNINIYCIVVYQQSLESVFLYYFGYINMYMFTRHLFYWLGQYPSVDFQDICVLMSILLLFVLCGFLGAAGVVRLITVMLYTHNLKNTRPIFSVLTYQLSQFSVLSSAILSVIPA